MGNRAIDSHTRRRGFGGGSATARAVGFDRVSSEDQVEGYSLEAQKQAIRALIDRKNFELARFYTDEGVSVRFEEIERRPALVALTRQPNH